MAYNLEFPRVFVEKSWAALCSGDTPCPTGARSAELKYLRKLLAQADLKILWDEVIPDLSSVRAVEVELADEKYLLHSSTKGCTGKVFAAAGIKGPPLAQGLTAPEGVKV